MVIRLVVGLGNPGTRYHATRHNIGYRVVDALDSSDHGRTKLFKPESVFMNESGIPIAALARKNGIGPDEMLIVCDDFAIPLGELRIRLKGSSGGHNGLKSIFEQIGTQEVPRLRVGIGPVPEGMDPADFVLQTFSKAETMAVESAVERARNAAHVAIEEGVTAAMNRFSGKGNA